MRPRTGAGLTGDVLMLCKRDMLNRFLAGRDEGKILIFAFLNLLPSIS